MTDTQEPQRCKSLSWTDKIRCIRPAGHTGDHTNQTATDINQIMWIDNPATSSDATDNPLREDIAAAIHDGPTWMLPASLAEEIADAVLPIVTGHLVHVTGELRTRAEQLAADLDRLEDETVGELNEKNIKLAREHAALKRAHVALAAQAGRDQAAVDRVGAECDRIEAAVRANPQDPDFDGAYLAAIGHIRAALQPPAHDAGPTVAEAADDDAAHWTTKYAGEGS